MAALHGRGLLVGSLDIGRLAATDRAGNRDIGLSPQGSSAEHGLAIESFSGVAGAHQLRDLPMALSGDEGDGAVVPGYVEHSRAKFAGITGRCSHNPWLGGAQFLSD